MALLSTAYFSGKNGTKFQLNLYYDVILQDYANNTSTIRYSLYWKSLGYSGSGSTCTGYINGIAVGTATSISTNENKLMGTYDVTVKHNDDGTFPTTTFSALIDTPWTLGDASTSGNLTSDSVGRIPRASVPSSTSGNIEETITIYTNRKSTSFTHTVTWGFGGLSGTIATGVADYITWTLPNSLYSQISNNTVGEGVIGVTTYDSNGNQVGNPQYCNFYAYAESSKCSPTIVIDAYDVNQTTLDLTGDNKKVVKFFSNVEVKATATPKNNANIINTTISNGITTVSANDYIFNNTESNYYKAYTVDSRKYNNTDDITLTLVDYIKLSCNVNVYRETEVGSKAILDVSGNYFGQNFGNKDNSLELKVRYKEKNATEWYDWLILNPTTTDIDYSLIYTFEDEFDYQKYYDFEVIATDKLMSVPAIDSLTAGIPTLGLFENIMEAWGKSLLIKEEEIIKFNVDLIYPVGSIYMSFSEINPSILFGGTWQKVTGRFLLGSGQAGANAYDGFGPLNDNGYIFGAGSTGGQFMNQLTTAQIPSHSHTVSIDNGGSHSHQTPYTTANWLRAGTSGDYVIPSSGGSPHSTSESGSHTHGASIGFSGGSLQHNNMPPYMVVNIWQRTA